MGLYEVHGGGRAANLYSVSATANSVNSVRVERVLQCADYFVVVIVNSAGALADGAFIFIYTA